MIRWGLTFRFLRVLALGLWSFSPLLLSLVLIIMFLGYLVGRNVRNSAQTHDDPAAYSGEGDQ